MAPGFGRIGADEIAISTRRRETEKPLHRRHDPPCDPIAHHLAQTGIADDHILSALQGRIDHGSGLAVDIEQEAGILATDLIEQADQIVAEVEFENSWDNENRRHQGDTDGITRCRQAADEIADHAVMAGRIVEPDIGDGRQHRIEYDRPVYAVGTVLPADRLVAIDDEIQTRPDDRRQHLKDLMGRRLTQDAEKYEMVFAKSRAFRQKFGQYLL